MPQADNLTHALANMYDGMSPGAQAEVRRGTPSEPFWRMLAVIDREEERDERLRKWQVLIQCVAIAGYEDMKFGVALQKADYSEARFKRLLEADDDLLPGILRRTAKQLKSAGHTGNWDTIRKLLFFTGDGAESIRLQLAQEYYTYDTNSNQDDNSDE
jgi:CRISPR system Cascade subunit CasB